MSNVLVYDVHSFSLLWFHNDRVTSHKQPIKKEAELELLIYVINTSTITEDVFVQFIAKFINYISRIN